MEQEICSLLDWDSEFFAYRIARLNLSQLRPKNIKVIDNWCRENQIDCLYFLADSDDARTTCLAEENAYGLRDIRIVLDLNLRKIQSENIQSFLSSDYEQIIATPSDTESLVTFVDNAFIHTRFYYDPRFTEEQCNQLYKTWLVRSIEEDFADVVLKLNYQGESAAFVSCILNSETATGVISLIGVAENMRGQGLGFAMVQIALNYFRQEGMQFAEVVTQARNIAAQRLYQKCGFRTKQTGLWYHKWFT